MKDLKSQLADAFGVAVPAETEAAPVADSVPDILSADAHLRDPWMDRLRTLAATNSSVTLAREPKPGQARQVTDQLIRILKKSGRKREATELSRLRSDFNARRAKAAWGSIKQQFQGMGLSDKAYRGLKQGNADPLKVLQKLKKADSGELSTMGAKRLREYLNS